MMDTVIADLRSFLSTELRVPDAETLDPELSLVRRGILDSIELMRVVNFIESRFGIRFEAHEILPSNLGSLAAMSAFVAKKRAA